MKLIEKYLLFSDSFLYVLHKTKFYYNVSLRWFALLFIKKRNVKPIYITVNNNNHFAGQVINLNYEFENTLYYSISFKNEDKLFYYKHNVDNNRLDLITMYKNIKPAGNNWRLIGTKLLTHETSFTFNCRFSNSDEIVLKAIGFGKNNFVKQIEFDSTIKLLNNEIILSKKQNNKLANINLKLKHNKMILLMQDKLMQINNAKVYINNKINLDTNTRLKITHKQFNKNEYL